MSFINLVSTHMHDLVFMWRSENSFAGTGFIQQPENLCAQVLSRGETKRPVPLLSMSEVRLEVPACIKSLPKTHESWTPELIFRFMSFHHTAFFTDTACCLTVITSLICEESQAVFSLFNFLSAHTDCTKYWVFLWHFYMFIESVWVIFLSCPLVSLSQHSPALPKHPFDFNKSLF